MATDSLGTRIKRARERKRWTQQQLADALEVNRKTVDNWENNRAVPRSSMGALIEVLGNLDGDGETVAYTHPDEVRIWEMTAFTEDERHKMIEGLRAVRRGARPTGT